MNGKLIAAERKITSAESRLSAAERYGSWCGYEEGWDDANAVITYEWPAHYESNMDRNALNYRSGVFTTPRSGVYLITYGYESWNDSGEETGTYLNKNGEFQDE